MLWNSLLENTKNTKDQARFKKVFLNLNECVLMYENAIFYSIIYLNGLLVFIRRCAYTSTYETFLILMFDLCIYYYYYY